MLRDILNRNIVSVELGASAVEAARLMKEKDVGCVLVLVDGEPRGLLTDRDLVLRCLAGELPSQDWRVEQVMTRAVEVCRETDGIFDCISKMRTAKVRRMPVIDVHGKAVGILSFGDLLAVLSKELNELTASTTSADEEVDHLAA